MQRNKSLFSRKIKCQHCGSSFKRKIERGKHKYVCSSYDNKGECIRVPIEEEFLISLIEKRLNKKINQHDIDKHIQMVMIESIDPYLLEIHFYDQESILFSKNGIRF